MAYEGLVTNAGSGGATLAVNTFTDTDTQTRAIPFSSIAFGPIDAIPENVTDDVGFPVKFATDQAAIDVAAAVGSPVFVRLSDGSSAISALPVTDNGGSLTVDAAVGSPAFVRLSDGANPISTLAVSVASLPSHDVTNAGTFAVQAAQSGAWSVAQSGSWSVSLDAGTNGIGKLTANSGVTIGAVEIAAAQTLATVTAVGTVTTVATVSTVTAVTTVDTVTTLTGSGVAHDSADSGNPHKIGAKATASLSGVALVSAGDRTDLFAGLDGVQITRPHTNLEDIVRGRAAITDGSSTSVISAQGSGIKVYITSVTVSNTSASAVEVDLRDGTAGTVLWTFPVPANTGGVVYSFPVPLAFSANTAVAADPSAAASTVTVSLLGFKSKV